MPELTPNERPHDREALIDRAVEYLAGGEVGEAADLLRLVQEKFDPGQYDLRRVVLLKARVSGVRDSVVATCLAESRRPGRPNFRAGDPSQIPDEWRRYPEVGYITPLENLPSIIAHGILSHERASDFPHRSVADDGVQALRQGVKVELSNGYMESLHRFAIAYLNPRNAMLFRVRADDVVVLMIDAPSALVLPGARVSSRNAAAAGAATFPAPEGLSNLSFGEVTAKQWVFNDRKNIARMQAMQAELLVPDMIPAHLISRVVTRTTEQTRRVEGLELGLPIAKESYTYFEQ
jgi:hypothetical protein